MESLRQYLSSCAAQPVPRGIAELAQRTAAGHPGTLAVLAYGSALRDANPENTLVDFYVLTEDWAGISSNALSRLMGRLIPPNVYYAEHAIEGSTFRSKSAALPFPDFERLVHQSTDNPYVWARFAQPCRIVLVSNDEITGRILEALQQSLRTAYAHAKALAPQLPPLAKWQALFENTYRTELRPESSTRAAQIIAADPNYYESVSRLMTDVTPIGANWRVKRIKGKLWSVARLAKAAFTFQGGADYAAWKIERHSGVKIKVTDWHRRHPILAGLWLLPKILRKGGMR